MSISQSSLAFALRPLEPCHADAFRSIRIEAMKTNLFVSLFTPEDGKTPLEVETTLPVSRYAQLLAPQADDGVFFGAFAGKVLAGFACIRRAVWR